VRKIRLNQKWRLLVAMLETEATVLQAVPTELSGIAFQQSAMFEMPPSATNIESVNDCIEILGREARISMTSPYGCRDVETTPYFALRLRVGILSYVVDETQVVV
jgi:hypothetical protein